MVYAQHYFLCKIIETVAVCKHAPSSAAAGAAAASCWAVAATCQTWQRRPTDHSLLQAFVPALRLQPKTRCMRQRTCSHVVISGGGTEKIKKMKVKHESENACMRELAPERAASAVPDDERRS
jgi:hypothetical protein